MGLSQKSKRYFLFQERERMQREKDKFELAQTEATNQIQSQLDSAMKQIRNLIQKNEDLDEELKKSQKTCEGSHKYNVLVILYI